GLTTLLKALAAAENPPFDIVGEGPDLDALKRDRDNLRLSNLTFRGRLSPQEVQVAMGRSKYVVIPSLCDENAPLAALEAMTMGRPLIVSDRGGLPELVRGGAGLMFPAHDASLLGAHIRTLDDEILWKKLSDAARCWAQSEVVPSVHLGRLEAAYQKVLGPVG
ncbi:MAG: glycosyltransferase, partial [Actinobacteria bacterium]|nr:glycosyltransferase [Actinomycetota bacterium]